MSYSSDQIQRITTARNTIRSRLAALGLVSSTADIDECAAAIGRVTLEMCSCTVVFNGTCKLYNIAYTEAVNGVPVARKVYAAGSTSYTLENVATQSLLVVGINGSGSITTAGGATDMGIFYSTSRAFNINAVNGATVTITIPSA